MIPFDTLSENISYLVSWAALGSEQDSTEVMVTQFNQTSSFSLLRFDFSGFIGHAYQVTHPSHFWSRGCAIVIQEVDCHVTHGGKSYSVTHTWVTGGVQQWLITQKGRGILDQRQLFSRAWGKVSVSQRRQRSDISELLSCPDCDDSEHTNGGSVVSCVKLPKVESQPVYIWHFKCFSSS